MTTLGKTVTLRKGMVVTDVGPATVNGRPDEMVRRMLPDRPLHDGHVELVLGRVVGELPVTHRRDSL